MGSGCFPFNENDREAIALREIADRLRAFHHDWYSSVYSGDSGGGQYDNAASDGAYLAYLEVAEELIRKCFPPERKATSPDAPARGVTP